ncbi:uncharacterized protein B0T23DRAFT_400744 [Neurospora hispaniola]|uniref:Uncharacterized protein n=1 Tax=Neurospora hispaniola TaxID=588809 RepID=A0AAJ0MUV0_9PEZI|nr:hypothetical protein B0T23DRAFT_400744 [Neurospora hispaniola]
MESLIKHPMSSHIKHSSNDFAGIAIGVVLESDGGSEKIWSGLRQPGVLLAYTPTLANALMALAFTQAAVMFFWVQATTPLPGEFRHFSAVIVVVLPNSTIDLPFGSLAMASWGPIGQFAPGFLDIVRDFINRAPIRMRGAFGFDVINCTELRNSSDTYDLDWPTYDSQRLHPEQRKNIIFETSVRPFYDDDLIMIQITTRRKTDTECTGMLLTHTCNLNPGADLDYPTAVNTMFPLWQLGASLFNSTSWMQDSYDHSYSANYEGLVASLSAANGTTAEFGSPCYHYFNDPMDYIIDTYREIAFRVSVRAAAGPSNNEYFAGKSSSVQQLPDLMQKGIPYTLHSTQVQYAADRPALVLAVIVSLVGPVAILFLFWGWWKLGRDFSMSPLKLANALLQQQGNSRAEQADEFGPANIDGSVGDDITIQDETATEMTHMSCNSVSGSDIDQQKGQHLASVFADCSGNATADELAKHFSQLSQRKKPNDGIENEEEEGEPIVQYGVVESGNGEYLGFAMVSGSQEAATAVRRPWKGELL